MHQSSTALEGITLSPLRVQGALHKSSTALEGITHEAITLSCLRESSSAYLSPLRVQGALHQSSTAKKISEMSSRMTLYKTLETRKSTECAVEKMEDG